MKTSHILLALIGLLAAYVYAVDVDALPVPPESTQISEIKDIWEGGQKVSYNTTQSNTDVMAFFKTALPEAGWTIEDSSDAAIGGGLSATSAAGGYLDINVFIGGPPTNTVFFSVCEWPTTPDESDCSANDD